MILLSLSGSPEFMVRSVVSMTTNGARLSTISMTTEDKLDLFPFIIVTFHTYLLRNKYMYQRDCLHFLPTSIDEINWKSYLLFYTLELCTFLTMQFIKTITVRLACTYRTQYVAFHDKKTDKSYWHFPNESDLYL